MELRRLVNAVIGPLPGIVAARINLLEIKQLDRKFPSVEPRSVFG